MSDAEAVGQGTHHGFDFLKTKVGPLPMGVWLAAGIVIWLYLQKKQKATSSTAAPNQQTDPAGNIGSIDPATGYVYGTPEDTAALATNNAGTSTSTGSTGQSGTTVGGTYSSNNAWAVAAINYLVGLGVDPAEANEAIQQYLASQVLTTNQQADVNLAIQGLGAPPTVPAPTGTNPPPVATPTPPTGTPTGTVYATNPPTGVAIAGVTANTVSLKWNNTANATGYQVNYGTSAGSLTSSTTAPANQGGVTVGGLNSGTTYYFSIQAQPAQAGAGSATASTQTSSSGSTVTPPAQQTHVYTVVKDDTLSGIAAKNGTTLAVIKQLNPVYWTDPKYQNGNRIFAGDHVTLPGPG